MKLSALSLSLGILGIISTSAFAANVENKNLKGETIVCPIEVDYLTIMDAMSQNTGRAKPTVDCHKPIQLAGGINFDVQTGNLNQGFMGENNDRFTSNDAYINITGHLNPWIRAFLEVSDNNINNTALNSANFNNFPGEYNSPLPGLYSAAYTLNEVSLQQAFITFGNPVYFPLFFKFGKQFQDYGRYKIHPITRNMTQVMTESLQTSADLSFISKWGKSYLHGSVYTFQNQIKQVDENDVGATTIATLPNQGDTNFGAQLSLSRVSHKFGFDVGVGYMHDLFGVNDIAYAAAFLQGGPQIADGEPVNTRQAYYTKRVSGATAYALANSGPFSIEAHYATALTNFDPFDLYLAPYDSHDELPENGPQPWAADALARYSFTYWERCQALHVGYSLSRDAEALFLPYHRWIAGYGVDVMRNANIGVEYSFDHAYSMTDGGNNKDSSRFAVRAAVMFG